MREYFKSKWAHQRLHLFGKLQKKVTLNRLTDCINL